MNLKVFKNQNSLKKKLLIGAKDLFWKFGIKKVSVEEICNYSGVSKMTFYRNFKNKEDILVNVMEAHMYNGLNKYKSIMVEKTSFDIKIKNIIKNENEISKGISKEFINEIYQIEDSPIKQKFDEYQKISLIEIRKDFKRAQKNGEIRKDYSLDFILYMLEDINKKAANKELQKLYPSEEYLIMNLIQMFFYGILPK